MTPGAIVPGVTAQEVCEPGYAKKTRHVSEAVKQSVFEASGLEGNHTGYCAGGCEIDHLISLELGGSNDPANLWPEPYTGTEWNAHVKDRLENRLHALVCNGQISLEEAQTAIRSNWIEAWQKYVGDAPIGARPASLRRD